LARGAGEAPGEKESVVRLAFSARPGSPANKIQARSPGRSARQKAGDRKEAQACEWLQRQGLRILARQVGYRVGELDAVARDGPVLVFVEVRSRRRGGWAAASIDAAKRRRIRLAAQQYLKANFGDRWPACRFDVVIAESGRFEWIRAAFGAEEEIG